MGQVMFETLPTEIRHNVLQNLDLPTIRSLRLASRSWAVVGEEHLVPHTYICLPHRDSITRLHNISLSPRLAQRIHSLILNLADLNEYQARHNIYFENYLLEPDERIKLQEATWRAYQEYSVLKQQYLSASCDKERLAPIFALLPNLRTLHVTLNTCPFTDNDVLEQIWTIPSTRLLARGDTINRFTSIISSLSHTVLRTLVHDRLPLEFFIEDSKFLPKLKSTFASLTSLSLSIERPETNLHNERSLTNLLHCLLSASFLSSLSLKFTGRAKTDITPLLLFQPIPRFPALHTLLFSGIIAGSTNLSAFLRAQSALRNLQLGTEGVRRGRNNPMNGGIYLSDGSFSTLCHDILLMGLAQENFRWQGDLCESESGRLFVLQDSVDVKALLNMAEEEP